LASAGDASQAKALDREPRCQRNGSLTFHRSEVDLWLAQLTFPDDHQLCSLGGSFSSR
jgi:hypothetical protein